MFLSCCDKSCDDKWTRLVDWEKMANITLATFSSFLRFSMGMSSQNEIAISLAT